MLRNIDHKVFGYFFLWITDNISIFVVRYWRLSKVPVVMNQLLYFKRYQTKTTNFLTKNSSQDIDIITKRVTNASFFFYFPQNSLNISSTINFLWAFRSTKVQALKFVGINTENEAATDQTDSGMLLTKLMKYLVISSKKKDKTIFSKQFSFMEKTFARPFLAAWLHRKPKPCLRLFDLDSTSMLVCIVINTHNSTTSSRYRCGKKWW